MVPPATLFLAWLRSGGFAFGGGAVALESIRRELVDRRQWMTEYEFSRNWALCQVAPGINLFGFALLVGRSLGGLKGAIAALMGMALPSAVVTLALAATFGALSRHPSVEAAMRGVVPATAGLGLASTFRTGRPLVQIGWDEKSWIRAATVLLPVGGMIGMLAGLPPVGLIVAGAALGALVWWRAAR